VGELGGGLDSFQAVVSRPMASRVRRWLRRGPNVRVGAEPSMNEGSES